MESHIKIRATIPEMNAFFGKTSAVRFMQIRDKNYTWDTIDRMPEEKRNAKTFTWFVILRHSGESTELHGTFTIPGITRKLKKLKAEQNVF